MLLVLLTAALFLFSCGDDGAGDAGDGADKESLFKSYFDVEFVSEVKKLTDAERIDAELIDVLKKDDVALLLLKTSMIDELNRVCETFTVYNLEKGEILEPISNVYDRVGVIPENGASKDEKADSTVTVKFIDISGFLPLVEVRTEVIEKIDEEVKEEDDDIVGEYVTVKDTYTYYDIFGSEIVTCSTSFENAKPTVGGIGGASTTLTIGKTTAVFDSLTYELLRVYNNENETVFNSYSFENENYYYYFTKELEGGFIEVFDKSGAKVYSKEMHNDFSAFVLSDGKIAVQEFSFVFDENAVGDVILGSDYYDLNTYTVNVETGDETWVEFDYVIWTSLSRDIIEKAEIPATEKAENILGAFLLDHNYIATQQTKLLVVDNDLKILYDTEKTYPIENTVLTFEAIAPGYLAIELSAVADKAIVDVDGNIVSFVDHSDKILENMVVTNKAIYDYKLKSLFNFKDNDMTFVAIVGNSVIAVNNVDTEADPANYKYIRTYYMLTLNEEGKIESKQIFDEKSKFVEAVGDVIIMQNEDNGKYTIYNNACEHILTTENTVNVIEINGYHVAITTVDGITISYVLK